MNSTFYWEKQWRELKPVDRLKKKTTILKPLLDQFWKVVSTCAALPKSLLGKALNYALGQKEALNDFLQYGAIDTSIILVNRR
ncbi:IS66 family transposase [Ligilactobacillus acidipiscis]|uniref:IS66 family transposase n=1 Tax=Ligilactobacillus acidipiscis TaxID=89059 RepID=UPI0012E3D83A